ncbi:MAG: gamma-glutamyltransferase [Actinobacteria bacterium]|nr:MAG: gamma-glutamyltransferase [Actinomycetota bacterium]
MPRTVIAAASDVAAEAGRSVADLGGNAVDAAISATIASMSTELGIVSPGGGAFITIWPPDSEPIVIDAYAEMPGRGTSAMASVSTNRVHMEYGGGIETVVGWGSVATPGAFAGFDVASRVHGTAPWAELFGPTIEVLQGGFTVSEASGYYLGYAHDVIYGWDPETAPMYHRPDGSAVRGGDVVSNPDLAACLRSLAVTGTDLLYRGDLGAALAHASQERGGLVTRHDLEEYAPVVRPPSRIDLRGWDIATNAPPAVGGIAITALLTLLERLHIRGWSASEVAKYASAQHAVFSFRRLRLDGDTDRFRGSDLLLTLAESADLIAMHRSQSTVQASAVDETGLACSITASAGYGSGAVIPGTGFGLNNSLGEVELTSEGLHALTPGTRLLSNMAPTVARSPEGEVMALGSPGADRITSAIASVLMNHIVVGMDLETAVSHPRIHAEVFDGVPTLAVEPDVDTSEVQDLAIRTLPALSMYFGGVQAAVWDGAGVLAGAADPRRTGAVRIGGRSD